jgi:hypothetical protein
MFDLGGWFKKICGEVGGRLDAWELPFSSASFEMALAEDKAACLNSSLSLIQLII